MLTFVASSGKDKGLRKKRKCRYGAPVQPVHTPHTAIETEESDYRTYVDRGLLPLTNLDAAPAPRLMTPQISHFVGYNQYLIRH